MSVHTANLFLIDRQDEANTLDSATVAESTYADGVFAFDQSHQKVLVVLRPQLHRQLRNLSTHQPAQKRPTHLDLVVSDLANHSSSFKAAAFSIIGNCNHSLRHCNSQHNSTLLHLTHKSTVPRRHGLHGLARKLGLEVRNDVQRVVGRYTRAETCEERDEIEESRRSSTRTHADALHTVDERHGDNRRVPEAQ